MPTYDLACSDCDVRFELPAGFPSRRRPGLPGVRCREGPAVHRLRHRPPEPWRAAGERRGGCCGGSCGCGTVATRRGAPTSDQLVVRLKRAEGQLRGVQRMLDEGAECRQVLTQLSAVKAAIDQVGLQIISERLRTCVADGGQDCVEQFDGRRGDLSPPRHAVALTARPACSASALGRRGEALDSRARHVRRLRLTVEEHRPQTGVRRADAVGAPGRLRQWTASSGASPSRSSAPWKTAASGLRAADHRARD